MARSYTRAHTAARRSLAQLGALEAAQAAHREGRDRDAMGALLQALDGTWGETGDVSAVLPRHDERRAVGEAVQALARGGQREAVALLARVLESMVARGV